MPAWFRTVSYTHLDVYKRQAQSGLEHSLQTLSEGLSADDSAKIHHAAEFALSIYGDRKLGSGEGVWHHALGMALILVGLKLDVDCRLAALLFAIPTYDEQGLIHIEERVGQGLSLIHI